MHSYQHNIKTFNSATRHLTRVERSLYRDLIELYYDTEQPIPADDFDRLCRWLLVSTDEEKSALKYVLGEYFELTGSVYTHDYCDEQIEKYKQAITAKSRAGAASAKAKKDRSDSRKKQRETRVQHVNNTSSTCVANQKPETSNQEQVTNKYKKNDQTPVGFDLFWSEYPKKAAKKDALKAFAKLNPDEALLGKIINHLSQRRLSHDWIKDGGAYIPHPATFLNGQRWEDQTTVAGATQQQSAGVAEFPDLRGGQ